MPLTHLLTDRLVVIAHRDDTPVLQVPGHLMTIHLRLYQHLISDSLEVFDGPTEVDAAHSLHENIQCLSFLDRGQRDGFLVFHPVNLSDVMPIDIYLCKIMTVVQQENTLYRHLWQLGSVFDHAPSAVHILHGQHLMTTALGRLVVADPHHLLQSDFRNCDDRHG